MSELALEVDDLETSERFYCALLELPVVDRWPQAVWLLAGSTRIGLWRSIDGIAGARGGAHVHFALHLGDADYDAVVDRLRHTGSTRMKKRSRHSTEVEPHT